MKHLQNILILLVVITVFFSAITLAKYSEAKQIKFAWYSQLANDFVIDTRTTDGDEWFAPEKEKVLDAVLINDSITYDSKVSETIKKTYPSQKIDFGNYSVIQVKLSVPKAFGYRVKVSGILQISKKIYIRVSINSVKDIGKEGEPLKYLLYDLVKIKKSDLGSISNFRYIFKDQYGSVLKILK